MDINENIKTLFREIEVYRSHSLFTEAKGKCQKLAKLIQQSDQIKNKQALLDIVAKKVKGLEKDVRKFGEEVASAKMSTREQDLIKKLFSFSKAKDSDSDALEAATALLIFGQFEKALIEFNELIKIDSLRVFAAKNILRCHIGLSSLDDAITQYSQWVSSGQFPAGGLEKIRSFLQDILNKKGIDKRLPKSGAIADFKEEEIQKEEFIDILSIKMPIADGKGVILDVSYQKGNFISVIIPGNNQVLIDNLKKGLKVNGVQFNSPAVVFKDSCVIAAINQIDSGPQKGNYVLVLRILNAG